MYRSVTRVMFAALATLMCCSGALVSTPTPPRRAPPPPPVHVLRELSAVGRSVRILSVDRQRRRIHIVSKFDTVRPAGSSGSVETIALSTGRVLTRWELPRKASTYFGSPTYWLNESGARPPWFVKLVHLVRSGRRRYVSSRPPYLAMSPSGGQVAFSYFADKMAVGPMRGGKVRLLNHGSPACCRPAFSPDGRWLAYSCYQRPLHEYCLSLVQLGPQGASRAPERFCKHRGYSHSGPYWSPDSSAFYALNVRGFGAYIDPVKKVCLARVDVKTRRETALWCRPLDGKGDRHRNVQFRMDPTGKHGVVIITDPDASSGRNELSWIRMSDGKLLTTMKNVQMDIENPYIFGQPTVLSADGRFLTASGVKGLMLLDLRLKRVRHLLPKLWVDQFDWDGGDHLVLMNRISQKRRQLIEVDLRRVLSSSSPESSASSPPPAARRNE